MYTRRLEASVVHSVLTQLDNLGWVVDERKRDCNVTQQRAKTEEQKKKLKGKMPDFVLYESGTTQPIGIIEAKRPGESLKKALYKARQDYAKPLKTPLIFAYNDTYCETRYLYNDRSLKIDGEDVRQFIDHYLALRFVHEGSEILSAPKHIQYSRGQLIGIFKEAANLLREAGLTAGLERFGAFSDILFLKIMDEFCELKLHSGEEPPLKDYIRWSHFQNMPAPELHKYIRDVVWKEMNRKYGTIFSEAMPIGNPEILKDIVNKLSDLNLTSSDTDVKGDAFEYFLKNAYQGLSIKDLGEYFTPRNIIRTMVSMVNPRFGEKIYDPFCGTGGFLIESFKYLQVRMKPSPELDYKLRCETIYGSEIASHARIAKMNMILFGDGHTNINREDSLANPKTGKFDIILTNPPYSQKTRYGDLYPVSSTNGDAMCAMHCFDSLSAGGRAAFLTKEDFLSKGGDVGKVREYIFRSAKNFSVVSLPRKLFIPYTPTKTSIIYLEKAGTRNTTFFYLVKNVGHTLSARKKTVKENDLPIMLDSFNSTKPSIEIDSCIVENANILSNDYCLWIYDYLEIYPKSTYPVDYLGNYIEEKTEKINPSEFPNEEFKILGVSNQFGIFENEVLQGVEIKQKYKQVHEGDLVYNPHRVNVGSIGLVPKECDAGYVSGIYVVFRSVSDKVPQNYILTLLKSDQYLEIISAYDTKYGAVRANLTYGQLCRIKIPILPEGKLTEFLKEQKRLFNLREQLRKQNKGLYDFISEFSSRSRIIKNRNQKLYKVNIAKKSLKSNELF